MGHRDDVEIRRMAATDMGAVCEVMGLAFADNPSTLANVHGDRARARRLMQEAVRVAKFGRRWSHALVAEQGGMVVGALNAAEWPHCQLGMVEKIKTAPAMVRIMKAALPRAFTMMNKREARDPHEPHCTSAQSVFDPNCKVTASGRRCSRHFSPPSTSRDHLRSSRPTWTATSCSTRVSVSR